MRGLFLSSRITAVSADARMLLVTSAGARTLLVIGINAWAFWGRRTLAHLPSSLPLSP
jgi:hypothetical protein